MTLFNEEHYEAYQSALQRLSSSQTKSKEYQTLVYLLTSKPEFIKKALPYLSTDGFDSYSCLKEKDFSSGDRELLKLSVNLFNNNLPSSPLDLVSSLDDESFQLAMNAIYLRKYGVK